ncbi:MAG: hypothetical protein AAGA45_01620, partial [Verrucomicrobiota bacterium]
YVRKVLAKPVGIIFPVRSDSGAHSSTKLKRAATFRKQVRQGLLQDSQFPNRIKDEHGEFHKPPLW